MKLRYKVSIDCANCASEVEKAISELHQVDKAVIDFINKTMTVDIKECETFNADEIGMAILRKALEVEPDFTMIPLKEDDDDDDDDVSLWSILIGIVFLIAGLAIEHLVEANIDGYILKAVFLVGLLLTGYDIFIKGIRNILGKKFLDENFLMSIATLSALIIGYWTESVAIMVFYKIGEYFEGRAIARSRSSVKALVSLKSPYSTVIRDGNEISVRSESVGIGETIVIRPGDLVSIDGIIESGESYLDTKAMTGEPVPVHVVPGDEVLSGYLNTESVLTVRTTHLYEDSAASKVLSLIEDAHIKKSKSEKFITLFTFCRKHNYRYL